MSRLVGPDVRAFKRCRMSGLGRSDVQAGVVALVSLGFGGAQISGQGAGCPGPREGPDVWACGPDVRGLLALCG